MEYESLLKLHYRDYSEYISTYESRINNECATFLNFSINDNDAFYLANQEVLLLVSKIMSVDKEVNIKIAKLPEVALSQFSIQLLVDEIKQTNDIESVFSTKKEIRETYNMIEQGKNEGRFIGLIRKYIKFQIKEEIKLESCEDIRNLYNELVLSEVIAEDKDNAPDGLIFRKDPVNIHTSTGKIIHSGVYPEDKIINAMSNALRVLNDSRINYLVSVASFHYMFAYIHPFYDGNGRMDRFISSYFISENLNHLAAYKLSYIIKKHQKQYYDMFSSTNDSRNKGDITPFVIQFLEFILEAEKEVLEEIDNKAASLNYYNSKLEKLNLDNFEYKAAYYLLLIALFGDEGVSMKTLCDVFDKSYNTIRKVVNHFEEMSIIRISAAGSKKVLDIDLNSLNEI